MLTRNEGWTARECSSSERNSIAKAARKDRIEDGRVARVAGCGAHAISKPSWTPTSSTAFT
jgi:hypothetical protein